ncbi:MAG: purine-nucleoside/S-methyl-5-thioadenosine phosphorylase / adenosine deaminase [Actinomycetota bacterium]|nr:purine-nucleoside/S-methyl-5-thioadenosine phosphorylase / adenosine deaminase [Actinomycetota bacterium]
MARGAVSVLTWIGAVGAARLGCTDRWGGTSRPPYDELNLGGHVGDRLDDVEENRRRLAGATGLPADRLLVASQVHGIEVAVVERPWSSLEEAPDADAMVTSVAGLALVVLVADCAPVLLASADPLVVGVAHAGRRGMAAGVVPATLRAMRDLGAEPASLVAHVGPAICGRCYEVPAALQDEVALREPLARSTTRSGTPALDLRAGVVAQLRVAGVASIEVDAACTFEAAQLFSHRRDGVTGRFAGVAWIPEPALT